MRPPDAYGALFISGDHTATVFAEGDDGQGCAMEQLVFTSLPLVLVPEGDAAILPADR